MTTDITESTKITRINGSIDRGGWQCQLQALRDTDLLAVNQRIDVSWRGIFGPHPAGIPRLAFVGYVLPARHEFDIIASRTNLTAETSDGFLRRGWLQGIGFAEVANRANYHQFEDTDPGCDVSDMDHAMTLGKLVKHILGYNDTCLDIGPNWVAHTNLVYHATENPHGWVDLNDVETSAWTAGNPDGSMTTSRYIIRETDNLWSRLEEIAKNEFFTIYFDKTDTLHYHKHPMYWAAGPPNPVMEFDEDFMQGGVIVTPRDSEQTRQVILHAVTDEGGTLHSEYPGSPTHVYGRVEERSRVRCNSQATLDDWAQRLYKYMNREYTVRVKANGLCGLLFELLDRVVITYTGTAANGVHIDWDEEPFWIHEIDVATNDGFGGATTFTLEAENV